MSLDKQLRSLGDVVERLGQMGVGVSVETVDEHDHRGTLLATLELEVPTDLNVDETPVPAVFREGAVELADSLTGLSDLDSQPESEDKHSDSTDTTSDETATDADLSAGEAALVDALAEHGEQSLANLQDRVDQGKSVYHRLSRLHDAGVVDRRADPDDGRRTLYALTDDDDAPLVDVDQEVDDSEDDDSDQEEIDEDQEVDDTEESEAGTDTESLTVADIDWLDESSFHVAVSESTGLESLADTLGWLDEDGDLAALVQGMDATDDLPDFQEGTA